LLYRTLHLSGIEQLTFEAGADAGSEWHLVVFVDNKKLLDREIDGGPLPSGNAAPNRHWEKVSLDLGSFANRAVTLRLYDLVLVPNRYAGNSYWRRIEVH
jgi:hypothetical protein